MSSIAGRLPDSRIIEAMEITQTGLGEDLPAEARNAALERVIALLDSVVGDPTADARSVEAAALIRRAVLQVSGRQLPIPCSATAASSIRDTDE
jgi:hypothetical protein